VLDDGRTVAGGNRILWGDTFHVPWVSRLLKTSESDETALDATFGDQGIFLFGDSTQWHDIGALDVSPTGAVVAPGSPAETMVRCWSSGSSTTDSSTRPSPARWRTIDLPNHGQENAARSPIAPDGSVFLAGVDSAGGAGSVLVVRLSSRGISIRASEPAAT